MKFRGLLRVPIAVVIFGVGTTQTYGFVTTSIRSHSIDYRAPALFESALTSTSALSALVYGTDGSVVGDDVFENPDDGVTKIADEEDNDGLLDSLKTSVDDPSIWNKIACAFAPPPHDKLTPEQVRDASPVGFSDHSIDIALALSISAEGGVATAASNQLIRVLVTVSFPQAWVFEKDASEKEKLSALRGQLKILEGLAEDRLLQQRTSNVSRNDPRYYENQVIEQKWKETLEEEPAAVGDGLPEWWAEIAPPFAPLDVREEAALLKKLLNEDEFEDDLRALFVEHSKNTSPLVYRASVASIGSSGLFLKARVAATVTDCDVINDDGNSNKKVGEIVATASIPYNNPPREVITAEELREGVLVLVESVVPMPMPLETDVASESDEETVTPFNEQVVEMIAKKESEAYRSLDGEEKDVEKKTVQMAEESPEPEPGAAASCATEREPQAEESEASPTTEDTSKSDAPQGLPSRQQPRPPEEEAALAAKYAAIEDLSERAFAILVDLGMVQVTGTN